MLENYKEVVEALESTNESVLSHRLNDILPRPHRDQRHRPAADAHRLDLGHEHRASPARARTPASSPSSASWSSSSWRPSCSSSAAAGSEDVSARDTPASMRACPRPHADTHATSRSPRRPWRSRRSAAPALGAGNYGADTCLEGYVWRGAIPTDHVCVTPLVRMQTAQENDQAAAHRSPTGGPYGPDTCLNGYVWREAVAERPRLRDPAAPPAGAQRQRPGRRASRRRARLDHLLPPVPAAVHRQPVHAALGRRAAHPRARRPHQPGHGDRAPAPDRHGPREGLAPAGRRRTRARRAACSSSPAGCCAARATPNAYFAVRDPASGRWSARVQRPDGLLDALGGTPRRAAGLAGGGPAALRDAWFRQQRGGMALPGQGRGGRLVALSRVEECASVSRLEGFDEDADRAPSRLCGSPVCRGCG